MRTFKLTPREYIEDKIADKADHFCRFRGDFIEKVFLKSDSNLANIRYEYRDWETFDMTTGYAEVNMHDICIDVTVISDEEMLEQAIERVKEMDRNELIKFWRGL